MKQENIPQEFIDAVNALNGGSIRTLILNTINHAKDWKEAQSGIRILMDSLTKEVENIRVNICGEEELILEGWHIADITGKAKEMEVDITKEQAISVLEYLKHHFDASIGVNWDSIESAIYGVVA